MGDGNRNGARGLMDEAADKAKGWFEGPGGEQRASATPVGATAGSQPYPPGDADPAFAGTASDTGATAMRGAAGKPGGPTDRGAERHDYGDDSHYRAARDAHLGSFDRDYGDYRRERTSDDGDDFGAWHATRQSQRSALRDIREHMEVVGKDGVHVGTVDKVRGERIVLTRNDPAAGGAHHAFPMSWIQGVGEKVMLNRHGDAARRDWQAYDRDGDDDPNSRALNERPGQGSDGPHILDRSFAGTYDN